MAFFIRSATKAPLTFDREQEQFRRGIPTGIYTGMQIHHGTAATYRVSLFAGVYAINGIVIFDDADQTDIFDLGAPGADEHHLIYVTYDPDVDTQPQYQIKEGTFASPATLTPTEASNGFVIADVWLPSTAADITDAVINNRDTIELQQSLVEFLGVQKALSFKRTQIEDAGAGIYRLHFDNMRLLTLSQKKGVDATPTQFPFVTHTLDTATTSTIYGGGGDDYEVEYDTSGSPSDTYVFFYVVEPQDYTSNATLTVNAIGHSETDTQASLANLAELLGDDDGSFTNQDYHPYRPDLKNTFIIAVLDVTNGWVHYANGIAMPIGEEFADGNYLHYVQTLSSTVYGTGPISPTSGDVDVDSVFDNISVLHAGTLDDVYDSFETGSAAGAGRSATIDAGAIDLSKVVDITPLAASGDQFWSTLRIGLDTTSTGDADAEERAIDVYTDEADSKRLALSQRRVFNHSTNGLMQSVPITLTDTGGQVQVTDATGTPDLPTVTEWRDDHTNDVHASRRLVTFPTFTGGDAQYKAYFLKFDVAGDYFYLETVDGVQDIDLTYNNDFNFAGTIDTDMTIWEDFVQLGQNSIVQNLEIQGNLEGAGNSVLISNMLFSGYGNTQDFIEGATEGEFQTSGGDIGIVNEGWEHIGNERSGKSVGTLSAESTEAAQLNNLFCDGRYIYLVNSHPGGGATVDVEIWNTNDSSQVTTITSTYNVTVQNVAIAANGEELVIAYQDDTNGGLAVELFDISAGTNSWSVNVGNGVFDTPANIVLHNNRLYVSIESTADDRILVILDATNGNEVTDSSGTGLNLARRADQLCRMKAYGEKLVLLSQPAATPSTVYATILNDNNAVTYDGVAQFDDLEGVENFALNSDFIYIVGHRTGSTSLFLFQYRLTQSGIDNEVSAETLLASSGDWDKPIIRCTDNPNRVILAYTNTTNDDSFLNVYNGDNMELIFQDKQIASTEERIHGMDIDHNNYFIQDSIDNNIKGYSLGRRGGPWFRHKNNTSSGAVESPFCQWLALPASGF